MSLNDETVTLRVQLTYRGSRSSYFPYDENPKLSAEQVLAVRNDASALKLPPPPLGSIRILRDGKISFQWKSNPNTRLYRLMLTLLRPVSQSPRERELEETMDNLSIVKLIFTSKSLYGRVIELSRYGSDDPPNTPHEPYLRRSFDYGQQVSPSLVSRIKRPGDSPTSTVTPLSAHLHENEGFSGQQQFLPLSARLSESGPSPIAGGIRRASVSSRTSGSSRPPPSPSSRPGQYEQSWPASTTKRKEFRPHNGIDWRNSRNENYNGNSRGSTVEVSPMTRGTKRAHSPASSSNTPTRDPVEFPPPATRLRIDSTDSVFYAQETGAVRNNNADINTSQSGGVSTEGRDYAQTPPRPASPNSRPYGTNNQSAAALDGRVAWDRQSWEGEAHRDHGHDNDDYARTPPPPSGNSMGMVKVDSGWASRSVRVEEGSGKIENLLEELENIRVELREGKERERDVLMELEKMGAGGEGGDTGGDVDMDRVRHDDDGNELVPKDLLIQAEQQLAEERRRRVEAECVVADMRRECKEPFLVPALVDVMQELSNLTTRALWDDQKTHWEVVPGRVEEDEEGEVMEQVVPSG